MPTYIDGYGFHYQDYLNDLPEIQNMEMHALHQKVIFQIIHSENALVLEVSENGYMGMPTGNRSNTFVVKKND